MIRSRSLLLRRIASKCAAVVIAAAPFCASCSGGASSTAIPSATHGGGTLPELRPAVRKGQSPAPAPTQAAPVPVTFSYTFPASLANQATSAPAGTAASVQRRVPASNGSYTGFTSTASAITMTLNVKPVGGSNTAYPGSCTASGSGTSGVCSAPFTASPGAVVLSGTLVENGNTIATFSQTEIIQPNVANTITFTANPVVASVALNLASPLINAGTPQDVPLAVNALDANGNIIAGTASYVDATGAPLALTLTVNNAQAGGRGTVVITGPPRITTPGQAAVYAHYDGNWLASSTISVASTRTLAGPLGTTTLTTIPTAQLIGGFTQTPNFITAGPDGDMYASECGSGTQAAVARISLSGTFTEFTTPAMSTCAGGITTGPDGNIWMTDVVNNFVFKMTPAGVFTKYTITGGGGGAISIAAGHDGNIWVSDCITGSGCTQIDRITMGGVITPFTSGFIAGGGTEGIGNGPDGNVWFIEPDANAYGKITPAGKVTTYTGTTDDGFLSDCLVTGPDHNIWFAEWNANAVAKVAPSGSLIAEYPLNGAPQCVTVGPDGAIWAAEGNNNYIAQITMGGVVNEYQTGVGPSGISAGPDGNIWYADQGDGMVGKFVL